MISCYSLLLYTIYKLVLCLVFLTCTHTFLGLKVKINRKGLSVSKRGMRYMSMESMVTPIKGAKEAEPVTAYKKIIHFPLDVAKRGSFTQ